MVVTHLRVRPPLRVRQSCRALCSLLPPLNFITLHYAYFITLCLLASVIFWGSSTPARSVTYIDSLFLTVSAMTGTGLNTINLSTLNTFQQIILFFLIMMGSAILVSSIVVQVRRMAFEAKFRKVVEDERARKKANSGPGLQMSIRNVFSRGQSQSRDRVSSADVARRGSTNGAERLEGRLSIQQLDEVASKETGAPGSLYVNSEGTMPPLDRGQQTFGDRRGDFSNSISRADDHIAFSEDTQFKILPEKGSHSHRHSRVLSMQGVGANPDATNTKFMIRPPSIRPTDPSDEDTAEKSPFFMGRLFPQSYVVGRNSQFHNLTLAERERLGGVEYRAVTLLAYLVPAYFVLWQLLSCIGLGAFIAHNRASTTRTNGLNPWWVGAFNAISAFNNSGMSLLDANMIAFHNAIYMLITMGLLILAGNTCYPIFLRLIIWTLRSMLPRNKSWSRRRETLQFLLDYPRRCYTNLFPSVHTWWLLCSVVTLNSIDWVAFEILNIGNKAVTSLPAGIRTIDGLFQAIAVRSGGFYVINISSLRISLQVLYVIMMYISVYPVVITMRNSNVYEERSLGIYADDPVPEKRSDDQGSFFGILKSRWSGRTVEETKRYFVRQQLRAQLAHDLWWIVFAIFLICIVEGGQFERDPAVYSVFNVIFETVSAYGCVGISVGLPSESYSFCGGWHVLSKLILCAVMLRGRHRGLPVAIDRAILLPGDHTEEAEEEDAQIRRERTLSRGTLV